MKKNNKLNKRKRRHNRILKKIGIQRFNKVRIQLVKTNLYIYVNIIDDKSNKILKSFDNRKLEKMPKTKSAIELSNIVAEYLHTNNINNVVFDRNGYKYHGILSAFVDGLRNKNIKI